MKRVLVVLLLAAAAAFAVWFGMRSRLATAISTATVTTLLPRDTVAFVHVPDFNRTRDQWHETELYKLWREPAVQAFLQRPLSKLPTTGTAREQIQDLGTLGMRDAFLAIISWDDHQPKLAAGFRFNGSAADAEKVIAKWRGRLEPDAPPISSSALDYQQHHVEVATQGSNTVATTFDGEWFFAANDVEVLKTLLDRLDGRAKDAAATLRSDEKYTAAAKHLPVGYAVAGYARVDRYVERLIARTPDAATSPQLASLRQIRTVAGASMFENGRARDVLFVGMPKLAESAGLSRDSLKLGTATTFLYAAALTHFANQLTGQTPAAPAPGIPAALQRIASAFTASGLASEDWSRAFGAEASVIGDWPENMRIPSLLATLPVKDADTANKIVGSLTRSTGAGQPWTTSANDGVQYYSMPPANPMIPIAPTIGISNQLLIAGGDAASVEAAFARSASDSALAGSDIFRSSESLVPKPTESFAYIDTPLLYTRLDAALRPMLVMGAAFVPGIAETVELDKLPAAEVITKHLGPIVVSQDYRGDGYVTESVGPVSLTEAVIGIGIAAGGGQMLHAAQKQFGSRSAGASPPPSGSPNAPLPVAPAASPSPADESDK